MIEIVMNVQFANIHPTKLKHTYHLQKRAVRISCVRQNIPFSLCV